MFRAFSRRRRLAATRIPLSNSAVCSSNALPANASSCLSPSSQLFQSMRSCAAAAPVTPETAAQTITSTISSSSSSSSPEAPAATTTPMCILCDEEVDDWMAHAATSRHAARSAVCQELCAPERNAAMLSQLWDHLRLDFGHVDAATAQRVARRQQRLTSVTKYLRDVSLLQDSMLFEQFATVDLTAPAAEKDSEKNRSEVDVASSKTKKTLAEEIFLGDAAEKLSDSLTVHSSFSKLVHVGTRALRAELMDRCMRLFPVASAPEVEAIVDLLCAPESIGIVFDQLSFKDCLFARMITVLSKNSENRGSTVNGSAGDAGGEGEEEGRPAQRPVVEQHIVVVPAVADYQQPLSAAMAASAASVYAKGTKPQQLQQQNQQRLNFSLLHPDPRVQTVLASARSTSTAHLVALSDEAKCHATLAMLGELSLFTTRDKPTSVASKEDADTLVSHVLATHIIENTVSELLHYVLQRVVDEGTPVWREYKDTVAGLVGSATRPKVLQLSAAPEKKATSASALTAGATSLLDEMISARHEVCNEQNDFDFDDVDDHEEAGGASSTLGEETAKKQLTFLDDILSRVSPPTPKIVWQTIVREGVKETSVPSQHRINNTAVFPAMLPKMNVRPMKHVPVVPPSAAAAAAAASKQMPSSPQQSSTSSSSSSSSAKTVDVAAVFEEEKKKKKTVEQQQQQQQQQQAAAAQPQQHKQRASPTSSSAPPEHKSQKMTSASAHQKPQQHQQQQPFRRLTNIQPSSSPSPVTGAKPITPQQARAGGAGQQQQQQQVPGRFRQQQQQTPTIRTMHTSPPAGGSAGAGAGGATGKPQRRRLVPVDPVPKK